ncbi:putative membrane-associated guanylate kinase, WW and PDZ domain-containing protein 1 isoform X1 [Apostichopus japonicus]|uniref:Putative membrane-associated guanylate kinase, WW and PDZ domain-containing protein 1 isoform X1 n=1 Tax=Stichopus japonicus TaxID=307972 RepID=A0A2G8JGG1_STIJA|nr:putative membrane-associated guanylate kinase, WW and PDZ domain-containing protein 1 isoform X1 [Apostichopus japonicus]
MPRRVQDPRAATLGRVPNRYPTNRETGFRPPERQGDQTQQPGSWMPPGQQRPPMKMTTGQPQYQRDDGRQVYSVELERGPTGFGFSLRGDKEYNTPFYILRMAESGPAARQGMMRVGDQLLRINNKSTENMTYKDAIEFIRTGGNRVSLTLQRLRPTGNNVRQQRPVSLFYPSDARGTAQTPPPMFHNAPLRNSNTSLQNNQPVHVQWTNASKTLQVGRTGAYLGQCGTKYQRETFVRLSDQDYDGILCHPRLQMALFVIPDDNGILCHPRFTMALFCCIV